MIDLETLPGCWPQRPAPTPDAPLACDAPPVVAVAVREGAQATAAHDESAQVIPPAPTAGRPKRPHDVPSRGFASPWAGSDTVRRRSRVVLHSVQIREVLSDNTPTTRDQARATVRDQCHDFYNRRRHTSTRRYTSTPPPTKPATTPHNQTRHEQRGNPKLDYLTRLDCYR